MALQILHSKYIVVSYSYVIVMYTIDCGVWQCKLIHEWIKKKAHKIERQNNKIFKQGIGIAGVVM